MADGRRVGEFPDEIIGDQRLPERVVLDECLEMALQQIGGDRHRGAYPGPPGHPRRTRTRRVAPSSMRGRLARPDARGIPSTSTVEMPRVTPLGFSTVIS